MIDADITWANSAPAGTAVTVDVAGAQAASGAVTVRNPSSVTALTVKVQGKETLGGSARWAEIDSVAVPAGEVRQFFVDELWLIGEGGRLSITNDTVLGAGDGFTGQVRVRIR